MKNKNDAVKINPRDFLISLGCKPGEINLHISHRIYGKDTMAPKINEDQIEFINCWVGFRTCKVSG